MKKHSRAFKMAVAGMVAAGIFLAVGTFVNSPIYPKVRQKAYLWYAVHIEQDPFAIAYDHFLKEADTMTEKQRLDNVQR